MPLFTNKFSPITKKTQNRKSISTLSKELNARRIEREFGSDVGPIKLRLGDQETVFQGGVWIPETGSIRGTFKENEKLKKEMQKLQEENNLLKIKFELMLDMLTQTKAEADLQKEEIQLLKHKLSRNKKSD